MQRAKDIAYQTALFGFGVYLGYANGCSTHTHIEIHTHKDLNDIPDPRGLETTKISFRWGQWGHSITTSRELDEKEIQGYIDN